MSDLEKHLKKTASQLVKKTEHRQSRPSRELFFNASVISIYGLQVALPVLMGILLGAFLDHVFPHELLSWQLNFIILGFIIGLIDANIWLKNSFQLTKEKNVRKH